MTALSIRPLAGSLGAEVTGVALAAPLIEGIQADLRATWLEHIALCFRDQHLDSDGFMSFASSIGQPVEYPFVPGVPGYPEIIEVVKREDETANFGGRWHSDTTYLEEPPIATMVLAREVPTFGGDTLFANQYAAYAALSPAMQQLLEPLCAVCTSALADVSKTREDRRRDASAAGYEPPAENYVAVHPVVRHHPETGRSALFVNVAHTERFDGMTVEESRPLLNFLFAHQVRPEFTVRVSWDVGSMVLWDNRCALHNPVNDYHGQRRIMHRITLAGGRPE
jgi:taurine dioxygenase